MPPDGVLSDNEEDYFQLGAHFVSGAPISLYSAVFDGSWHRILSDALLGVLVRLTGFGAAQVIARTLAALAYAMALRTLFRRFGLSTIDAVLVVVTFTLMGQTIIGGEWLFNGYEAKVAAYCFVLVGLAMVLDGRNYAAVSLLFAAATYFHFLVGLYWFFAAMALAVIEERGQWRRLVRSALLFALLVAPTIAAIVATRWFGQAPPDPTAPTPDVIYSIIRAPHHTSPFLETRTFLTQWLPGYLLAAAMLAGGILARATAGAARITSLASWLSLLLVLLFVALIASFFDRHTGVLGKFYLFRPSSLVLLLWLAMMLAWLNWVGLPHGAKLKALGLALLLPSFLLAAGNRVASDLADGDLAADKRRVFALLAEAAAAQSVVLVDPALDFSFFDVERQTGHPALVNWKFMPTGNAEIVEWYKRIEFRRRVFAEGCSADGRYPVDFLVAAPEHAADLAKTCGRIVYSGKALVLLQRSG